MMFDRAGVSFDPIGEDDLETIRMWRNDERVRRWMISQEMISSNDQIHWWERRRVDPSYRQFVLRYDDVPIGTINFSGIGESDAIRAGYFVAPGTAPRGAGTLLMLCGLTEVFESAIASIVRCAIYPDNTPSIRLVERFGYTEGPAERGMRAFTIDSATFAGVRQAIEFRLFGVEVTSE